MAKEIRLPDIGDFKDVPIIEILVAPGQSVRKDETILSLQAFPEHDRRHAARRRLAFPKSWRIG